MNDIKISVLVTFFNQKEYVDRAISSIIQQKIDYKIEIVIGDDGSDDGTLDRINAWIDKYPDIISLYIMERDNGSYIAGTRASQNRLNILKHVRGEYFIFLDGDDYFSNELKLAKQVEILDSVLYQDCVCCGHKITALYSDGSTHIFDGTQKLKEGVVPSIKYWKDSYLHTDTLLIRSSVIPLLAINELKESFNDNLITFAVIQFGNIYYIDEPMAIYDQTMSGIWTSEKEVIKWIRKMTVVDICQRINPKMKKATMHRMAGCWTHLYKMRNEINIDGTQKYIDLAKRNNYKFTLMWLSYNDLSYIQQKYLVLLTLWYAKSEIMHRIMSFIYHRIIPFNS